MRPSSRPRSTRMWRLFVSGAAGRAPAPGAGRRSSPPTVTCSTSPAARTARSISATPAAPPMRKLKRPSNSSASNADSGGVTACTGPTACAFLITSSARPPLSGASARSVTCTSRPTATGGTSPPGSPSPLRGEGARGSGPTGARFAGLFSHSSSSWLQALRCSRLSARNSSAYCERSMESAEDALHGLEHARRLERLHDEILRAGLDRLDHEGLLTHGAAHEDLGIGIVLHDLAHRVDPAHVGHHDVHGDEIGLELPILLDRLRSRLRFAHDLESGLRQDVADHRPHEDGVVADEDSVAHTSYLGRQNGG